MSIKRTAPMRPEQLGTVSEQIDAVTIEIIPDGVPGSMALRALVTEGIRKYLDTLPLGNFPPVFRPGERVALVSSQNGPTRPGTVVEIDLEPVLMAHLRVRFDDGEERQINPDVIRRIKNQEG